MNFDVLIAGAGPGGTTAAICMARTGLKVLVVDQATFPRDKICGDAISGKSMTVLRRLGLEQTIADSQNVGSWGVTFGGPSGKEAPIAFTKEMTKPIAPGYIVPRLVYDNILFEAAQKSGAEIWEGTTVTDLIRDDERVIGLKVRKGEQEEQVFAPLVIGADGAYSVVAKKLGFTQLDEAHYCGGLRAYYEGVTGFNEHNFIELHFVDEAIPGYFWIFPMANNRANVGIGMLSEQIKKRNVKLKDLLNAMVEHPQFKERFKNAKRIGTVKGWGLPLGSKPRPMAGDGWLLLGDAASLIDPFTGEGIGNAMISAEIAATWAKMAKEQNNYAAAFLQGYEKEVLLELQDELKLSHWMQRLGNWKWLLNKVVDKASRSQEIRDTISCMFDDHTERKKLLTPAFYWKILTA
jgi:geranylgeranyl reductase family protein